MPGILPDTPSQHMGVLSPALWGGTMKHHAQFTDEKTVAGEVKMFAWDHPAAKWHPRLTVAPIIQGAALPCHVRERLQKNSLGENQAIMLKDSCGLLPSFLPSEILHKAASSPSPLASSSSNDTWIRVATWTSSSQAQTDPKEAMAFSQSSNCGSEPGTHHRPCLRWCRQKQDKRDPTVGRYRWGRGSRHSFPITPQGTGSPWRHRDSTEGWSPLQAGVALNLCALAYLVSQAQCRPVWSILGEPRRQQSANLFFFFATPRGMWDLSSSTRDQTHAPYSGRAGS